MIFFTLSQNGKKHRREPKSMTDEEYEEIFAAVLAATPDQLKETNKPGSYLFKFN